MSKTDNKVYELSNLSKDKKNFLITLKLFNYNIKSTFQLANIRIKQHFEIKLKSDFFSHILV